MLREALERVMALQPSYSAAISEQMRERGNLVRRVIPEALREARLEIASVLDEAGDRLLFVGSDGVGHKRLPIAGFVSHPAIIPPIRKQDGTSYSYSMRRAKESTSR
jgi:hypothetical protein